MNKYSNRISLKEGIPINDEIYDGKSDFELVRERIISPNVDWARPIFHPFSLEELVCVHITDQEVKEDYLKPHSYHPYVPSSMNRNEGDQWFFPRETLHFTLNGPVAPHHGEGPLTHQVSWKNKKIAYIIPLKDIIDKVICLFTHDTIALGKIKLLDSTIIVTEQSDEKVTEKIRKLGYQPLQIRGCAKYDPAFLEGTNININHITNFQRIIKEYGIDGPYDSVPLDNLLVLFNNILVLDDFITDICEYVSRGNGSIILDYPGIIENMKDRMYYLSKRWGNDPSKATAIRRLNKGFQKYVNLLEQLKKAKTPRQKKKLEDSILWRNRFLKIPD